MNWICSVCIVSASGSHKPTELEAETQEQGLRKPRLCRDLREDDRESSEELEYLRTR